MMNLYNVTIETYAGMVYATMNKGVQHVQLSTIDKFSDVTSESCTRLIAELLTSGQRLCKQTQEIGEQLSEAIMRITEGKARLLLSFTKSSTQWKDSFLVFVSFHVHFDNRSYGTLEISSQQDEPSTPALPLPLAQLLANICGLLLHNIELSLFIKGQSKRIDHQATVKLTKREREVLEFICSGDDQKTIAAALGIAPATVETYRKRLYGKLGVHSERDISLAAYQAGLFSVFMASRASKE